ncbi:MAG: SRPBCC family protein [Acidimicrobiia bacterium]
MRITQEFDVARPVAQVWSMFQDVGAVAQCLPGAMLTEDKGNNVYGGSVAVKLGPIAATFEGEATIAPDPANHSALIEGRGVDKRGGSRGQVKVNYALAPSESGGTKVSIDADVTLAGPAAQFGRTGLINEMSKRMIGDFANCLEAKMAAPTIEEAGAIEIRDVKPVTLLWQSFLAWLRRVLTRK